MARAADADEAAEKRICSSCIGDDYLKAKVDREGVFGNCDYCNTGGPTISIGDFGELAHVVFETYFDRTSSEPEGVEAIAHNDPEGGYNWERKGDPANELIQEFARVDDEPANDVHIVLEDRHNSMDDWNDEQEYGEEACYADKDVFAERFHSRWLEFERSLRTEARLFNKAARELFEDIFAGITQHFTRAGTAIFVSAGPGTAMPVFFRARTFTPGQDVEKALAQPDTNLGPPPPSVATPGRMNARGISVFYGATAPEVALAEVRPPVGSRVVIARFEVLRPLKLLAIKELQSVYARGSRFDPHHMLRVERAKLLGRISALMSMPAMPSDDGFDYIVTQAIAEYLANESGLAIHGLLFPSVQTGDDSLNVVLFRKASRVRKWESQGTIEVSSYMSGEDGPEEDYWVTESINQEAKAAQREPPWRTARDERTATLAIDVKTLHVHEVKAVMFDTTDYPVSWHVVDPSIKPKY
jgi:hypothetical protein